MIFDETYTMNNGVKIPKLALGTWLIENDAAKDAVKNAIKIGYHHIDTAQAYENEQGVGEGVRASGISRDKIFVTSKVAAENKSYRSAADSIDETLKKTGFDYMDMMLIHSPQPWAEVRHSRFEHIRPMLVKFPHNCLFGTCKAPSLATPCKNSCVKIFRRIGSASSKRANFFAREGKSAVNSLSINEHFNALLRKICLFEPNGVRVCYA